MFFINVPIGIAAFIGMTAFLKDKETLSATRLDFFGFAVLALAIGRLQLMLDREPAARPVPFRQK